MWRVHEVSSASAGRTGWWRRCGTGRSAGDGFGLAPVGGDRGEGEATRLSGAVHAHDYVLAPAFLRSRGVDPRRGDHVRQA